MKRTLLVVVLTAAAVAPAGAADDSLLPARDAVDRAEQLRAIASTFPTSSADRLIRAAELAGSSATAAPLPARSFTDAINALYRAAGEPARSITPPPGPVAVAAAPVIGAIADASTVTRAALAGLTPAERRWALNNLDAREVPDARGKRLQELAARVDLDAIASAAATIASAIDAIPDGIEFPRTWVDPSGAIEIGSTANDVFTVDRVLVLDLGGNDQHLNAAGAIGPVITNTLGLPVSVTVDLGGDDNYQVTVPNQPQNTIVAQGTGLGGIGLLLDRWGNDQYYTSLSGGYPDVCIGDPVFAGFPGQFPQRILAQATAALGVGALLDLSGSDNSFAFSSVATPTNCHFVRNSVHAQGAGLQRGVALLADDLGTDVRQIYSQSQGFPGYYGAQDFVAGAYGQGFGAGGAGILLDKEGNDFNYAWSYATWNYNNANKGAFATTFVQGAASGLLADYSANVFGPIAEATGAALPCAPSRSDGAGGHGGQSGQCLLAGVGLHLDLLGADAFYATSHANEGVSNQCFVGSVALTGAQGSAAWGGLGGLANLDVAGADVFWMGPSAVGAPCYGDQTRAIAAGQGFGGAVDYPIWDDPESWYAGTDTVTITVPPAPATVRATVPAVGVLVSAGPACAPENAGIGSSGQPDVAAGCTAALQDATDSPDVYQSYPSAYNPEAVAIAESWVQGSGGRPRYAYTPVPVLVAASGIGVLVDSGGDDVHDSFPYAYGASGSTARTVAQGATEGGIGALVNIFGEDTYSSMPTVFGGSATALQQGDARGGFGEPGMPVAAFVDIGGDDTYGPAATCQGDGGLPGWFTWGDLGTCGAQAGTLIIGLDAATGVAI